MTLDRVEPVAIPKESTVSVRVARGLIYATEQLGVPRAQFLRAARLEPDLLERPDFRLTQSEIARLIGLAIELSGDPALGLHWGERVDGYTFELVAQLMAHAPTLRAGLQAVLEFRRLLTDDLSFELVERDDVVVMRCRLLPDQPLPVQRFHAEMVAMGFFKIIRAYNATARPERVSFEYPAPSYVEEYTRLFEGTARFDQTFTGVTFDRALMDAAAPHKDDDVHGTLRSLAERRMLRLRERTPYALRVRDFLVKQGPSYRSDMEAVARSLGISGRSLRRRLASEGHTYDQVASEALAIMAKHLLATTGATIQETAYAFGFSHASTFHRAFKRWTGMTPLAYRTEQLRNQVRS